MKAKTTYFRREILDLPVFKKNHEKELARVKDILLDLTKGECLGLAIEAAGVWKNIKFLPWENVTEISENHIITEFTKPLHPLGKRREKFLAAHWIGRRLWRENNILCGTVADIAIEKAVKESPDFLSLGGAFYAISGIAMSGGIWQDMDCGWILIPWAQIAPVALAEMNQIGKNGN